MLVLIKAERDIVISRSRNYLIEDILSQVYFKNITQVSNKIMRELVNAYNNSYHRRIFILTIKHVFSNSNIRGSC